MMTVMNSLCQALAPKNSTGGSPVKRAELRGTYMKQLTELKQNIFSMKKSMKNNVLTYQTDTATIVSSNIVA